MIAAADAAAVLYVADGQRDVPKPGSFYEALAHAAFKADPTNSARLAMAFPGMVEAVDLYKNVDNGVDVLRAIVQGTAR